MQQHHVWVDWVQYNISIGKLEKIIKHPLLAYFLKCYLEQNPVTWFITNSPQLPRPVHSTSLDCNKKCNESILSFFLKNIFLIWTNSTAHSTHCNSLIGMTYQSTIYSHHSSTPTPQNFLKCTALSSLSSSSSSSYPYITWFLLKADLNPRCRKGYYDALT